jgi:hypothetical protein
MFLETPVNLIGLHALQLRIKKVLFLVRVVGTSNPASLHFYADHACP